MGLNRSSSTKFANIPLDSDTYTGGTVTSSFEGVNMGNKEKVSLTKLP
jgi:hypothetical protein